MLKYFSCITFIICIALISFSSCENKTNSVSNQQRSKIHSLTQEINKDPRNLELLLSRANYYRERSNWDLVLFDVKQCLSIDSTNMEANFLAGKAYFEISKINHKKTNYPYLSLKYLENAIKYNNKNTETLLLYSRVLIAFSRYNEALSSINNALTINYNLEEGHLLLGYVFKSLGKEEEAINCFNNSIQVNPDFSEGYIQLARIFHDKTFFIATPIS